MREVQDAPGTALSRRTADVATLGQLTTRPLTMMRTAMVAVAAGALGVGLLATAVSTAVAVVYGAVSGAAPDWLDGLMMRFPGNIDAYLSHRFGDYMTLPPEDKRHNHPPYRLDFGDGSPAMGTHTPAEKEEK